jgi:peptidase C25-like protein/lamin tail-like protein
MKNNRSAKTHFGSDPKSARTRQWRLSLVALLIAAAVITGASYLASPPASQALSSSIVISQIYTNGGSAGAAYRNDYIELFNRGSAPVNVGGWSVQYAVGNGANSSTWTVTALCGGTCIIDPNTYYLVQQGSSGAGGVLLPIADATGAIDLSSNNGKVALVNTTTALTTTGCPFPASVVDFVGYGSSANCSEGNAVAPNPGNNDQSICRNANGFTETDNNTNDFTLCAPNPRNSASPPALAKMNLFKASGYDDGKVLLEWQTGYEVDNLGFNIYRERGGKRTRINSQLIAGSALMVGSAALTAGNSYRFWDDASNTNDVVYWIEDVALSGRSTWHDPIAVDRQVGRGLQPPDNRRPVFLDSLGRTQDPTAPAENRAGLVKPTPALLELQSSLTSRAAVKLAIQGEGWYRVTQPELVAAGFNPKTNPAYLQMFVDGQEQPIGVITESDGGFGPNSAIEFYGVGIDATSTEKHVYWLTAGSEPGARIQQVKGKGSRVANASFPYTVERKDRTVYFSGLRNGDKENFFGAVVSSSPVDQSILVQHLDKTSTEQAELQVALQGVTLTAHRVRVSLNDQPLGEVVFDYQDAGVLRLNVPHSLLKEGQNQVRLTSVGGDRDISLVDHIKLTYGHAYIADDDVLRFTAKGKQRITVDGFSNSEIRVLDITDPNDVLEVTTAVERKGSYSVSFSAPAKRQRTLLAFASNRISKPAELIADQPSNLRSSQEGADFVIITSRGFASALEPLKSLRERQGLKVAVVDVEDIYDEFSFGQKSPEAVRDFLAFATSRWDTAPRHVLLAGDASFDPKNYLDKGDFDVVPTKLIDTRFMETASDDWFTDFDADGSANIPSGRLPVRTAQEAAAMIAKIAGYESSAKPEGVLLVSDSQDGFDFAAANAGLRTLVPAGVRVDEVDRGKVGDVMARAQLLDGINRGPQIVNYIGHGSVDLWKAGLITSADAASLTNKQSLSLFFAMTCLNGYFQDPVLDSLAESLLKAEHGGAVAVWASSGMTTSDKQATMDRAMFSLMFAGDSGLTLGEATLKAKTATGDGDVRRTWILFGDPTMKIK